MFILALNVSAIPSINLEPSLIVTAYSLSFNVYLAESSSLLGLPLALRVLISDPVVTLLYS